MYTASVCALTGAYIVCATVPFNQGAPEIWTFQSRPQEIRTSQLGPPKSGPP